MSTPADGAARRFATDPTHNVVLEASAGTGKTTVLVERYVNLLRAGVAPANILAITFTRQAAAEMRARILGALRREAAESAAGRARWNALRDRLGDVAVSTVDAFCLALLREFPLEADLDPDFDIADETELPGLVDESIALALDAAARRAERDPALAMLLARLGPGRCGEALRSLLERRLTAGEALQRSLQGAPADLDGEQACRRAAERLADCLAGLPAEFATLTDLAELHDTDVELLAADLRRAPAMVTAAPPAVRAWLERLRTAFLTRQGAPRKRFVVAAADAAARRRYGAAAGRVAPLVHDVLQAFDRDVNLVMARAVRTLFDLAVAQYEQVLRSRALLDFSGVLQRAVELLRRMDEFARSRFRLESRYHHVLVDEFQDTSRLQWELVSLLVRSWGEGSGLVEEAPLAPTIFVVGDRKQSIYRFRDADVATFGEATAAIAALRAGGEVRRSIAHSFRAVPELLGFVNDLFVEIGAAAEGRETFSYDEEDRFPVQVAAGGGDALGLVVAPGIEACADAVAAEVAALLDGAQVRPKDGGAPRGVRPEDVAVLFRTRESHREFERALSARGVRTYVYKGLGFADAEEVKDVRALIRFLARPSSELRAAALLRSRIARISDAGLLALAGGLSAALVDPDPPPGAASLDAEDRRVLDMARSGLREWMALTDRLPPAELLDHVLQSTAYAFELRGPNAAQAQANLRRLRGLVRRIQNRGYATMARVSEQIERLSAGMANAVVETVDAVSLMTVHAAKGLEFPIVFLVDLGRGTRLNEPPVRIVPDLGDGESLVAVWPHRSAGDDEERRRDFEETKRLLYVAATRARERLYLSAVVRDGAPAFNRGSFGSVLPDGFAAVFGQAAATPAGERVVWRGRSGAEHRLRVCAPEAPSPAAGANPR